MRKKKAESKKRKSGRKAKCTGNFLSVAADVLTKDINAIICTDEELLLLINERLTEKERICHATFENWKAGKLDTNGVLFLGLIKKALLLQKQNLFKKYSNAPSGVWQKWAWIIERKFDDWNIRKKAEVLVKGYEVGLPSGETADEFE